ncbi:DNA polymerase [Gregarina niphandrodes]|uniref:DNA polymerase n=1 Tax=Gregarina niphandrodes TaxID=110365 RepID=A0A023B8W0_GRENI|nr:DNA polymerase [Gregarina niphandrodes]EZG70485.1 DNA polymerase [Gregarina niphandrodes]|eukprot:XP_011129936.1 DNA polymerase [Gregarina niphandrodes]
MLGFRPVTIDCVYSHTFKPGLGDTLTNAISGLQVYTCSQIVMTGTTLVCASNRSQDRVPESQLPGSQGLSEDVLGWNPSVKAGPESVVYVHGFKPIMYFRIEKFLVDAALSQLGECSCGQCDQLTVVCVRCSGDNLNTLPLTSDHNCCRVCKFTNALIEAGIRHHPDMSREIHQVKMAEKRTKRSLALIYNVQLVAKRPLYGYHLNSSLFAQISCCQPYDPPRIGSMIIQGLFGGIPLQCYELHISAVVRFMRMCGIAGPEWLYFQRRNCFLRSSNKECVNNVFEFDINMAHLINVTAGTHTATKLVDGPSAVGTTCTDGCNLVDLCKEADRNFVWDVRQIENTVQKWSADMSLLDSPWESYRNTEIDVMDTMPRYCQEDLSRIVQAIERAHTCVRPDEIEETGAKSNAGPVETTAILLSQVHFDNSQPFATEVPKPYSTNPDCLKQKNPYAYRYLKGCPIGHIERCAAGRTGDELPMVGRNYVYFIPPPDKELLMNELLVLKKNGIIKCSDPEDALLLSAPLASAPTQNFEPPVSTSPKSSVYQKIDKVTTKSPAHKRFGRLLYVEPVLNICPPVDRGSDGVPCLVDGSSVDMPNAEGETEDIALRQIACLKRDRGIPEIDQVTCIVLSWEEYLIGGDASKPTGTVLLYLDGSEGTTGGKEWTGENATGGSQGCKEDTEADHIIRSFPPSSRNPYMTPGTPEAQQLLPNCLCNVQILSNEIDLISTAFKFIRLIDPTIIVGWDNKFYGIGYLWARYKFLTGDPACTLQVSRFTNTTFNLPVDAARAKLSSKICKIGGRTYLNGGKLCREDTKLNDVSFLNMVKCTLGLILPRMELHVLSLYWHTGGRRAFVIRMIMNRVEAFRRMLWKQGVIGKYVSLSSVFYVEWSASITRGSQFFVEAIMLSACRNLGCILSSLSKQQVRDQDALEAIPMVLEPKSKCYTCPVIVVDYQSLYPSLMIAYNICYSTCIGKAHRVYQAINQYLQNPNTDFGNIRIGGVDVALNMKEIVHALAQDPKSFHVLPNGVMFCNKSIREGVLPVIMRSVLASRIFVKRAMSRGKKRLSSEVLSLMNFSQQSLKFVSVTTYGYIGASVTGRMPCGDIADGIVSSGRHLLDCTMHWIEAQDFGRPIEVVYGDTDSCFIHVPGSSMPEAFNIGQQVCAMIVRKTLHPLTLKLEKVYESCVLQTKKRYVGHAYETLDDWLSERIVLPRLPSASPSEIMEKRLYKLLTLGPIRYGLKGFFDSKGVEASRRDQSDLIQIAVSRILKSMFYWRDLAQVQREFKKIVLEIGKATTKNVITQLDDIKPFSGRIVDSEAAFGYPKDWLQYGRASHGKTLSFKGRETRHIWPRDFIAIKRLKLGHYSYHGTNKAHTLPPQAVVALWCQNILRSGLPMLKKLNTKYEPFAKGRNHFNFRGNAERTTGPREDGVNSEGDQDDEGTDEQEEPPEEQGFMYHTGEGFGYVIAAGSGTLNSLAALPSRCVSTPFFPLGREHVWSAVTHRWYLSLNNLQLNEEYYRRVVTATVSRMLDLLDPLPPSAAFQWLKSMHHVNRAEGLSAEPLGLCTFAALDPFSLPSTQLLFWGLRGHERRTLGRDQRTLGHEQGEQIVVEVDRPATIDEATDRNTTTTDSTRTNAPERRHDGPHLRTRRRPAPYNAVLKGVTLGVYVTAKKTTQTPPVPQPPPLTLGGQVDDWKRCQRPTAVSIHPQTRSLVMTDGADLRDLDEPEPDPAEADQPTSTKPTSTKPTSASLKEHVFLHDAQSKLVMCRRLCLMCTGGCLEDVENCVDAYHCPVYSMRTNLSRIMR